VWQRDGDLRATFPYPDTGAVVRDRALLLVGFAGAFRRSELVSLDLADVTFNVDGLVVQLRRSKTDQEGQGRKVGHTMRITEAGLQVFPRILRRTQEGQRPDKPAMLEWTPRHAVPPFRRWRLLARSSLMSRFPGLTRQLRRTPPIQCQVRTPEW